jgi:hypothetical protein
MYEFQLLDLIMAGVFAVLILAFAVSLTHSLMKEKVRVYKQHTQTAVDAWLEIHTKMVEAQWATFQLSSEIPSLILKAKREHGKKVRKAADRKLERTERDYEARMNSLLNTSNLWKSQCQRNAENLGHARAELSAFQSIVSQELDNYIRLPSVRNACLKAINANHKAWQEL